MNKLMSIVRKINLLPEIARSRALSLFFGKTVKYAGTTGIVVEELTQRRCVITLKNRRAVRNHIGSVHAVANALIAESATGFLVGMNVQDHAVPVIKTMKLDYVKRAKGDMRAEAHLTEEQVHAIQTLEKGEVTVAVAITDSEDKEPVMAEMIWAWTPKRR
ncbi:DUF4442 domain-containing protein [Hahella sp. NBU794]|uniref:DUF4442 domain-containing protein n=1 Tax=Hahella sp. NBU794 TaxID=3422590 RepID=UPI003D6FE64B